MINLTPLTRGCFPALMAETYNGEDPVLQVLGTKKVSGAGGNERYRLLLSDGQYIQSFVMLSTHLNKFVENGNLSDYTIIRVKQHITSVVNNTNEKRVFIVIDLDVLHKGTEVGDKIGDPVSLEMTKPNSGSVKHVPVRPVDLQTKIAQLEEQNRQQRAEIEQKNAKIAEQGTKIAELVAKIAEHGVKIERLEESIAEVLQNPPA